MNTACTDCDQKRLVAAPFLPVPAGIRAAAGPFAVFAARGAMQVLWHPGQSPHRSGNLDGEPSIFWVKTDQTSETTTVSLAVQAHWRSLHVDTVMHNVKWMSPCSFIKEFQAHRQPEKHGSYQIDILNTFLTNCEV